MKVDIKVELQPFQVPYFVILNSNIVTCRGDPKELLKLSLSEIDADTLERLCEQFTREVFKRAKKPRTPKAVPE